MTVHIDYDCHPPEYWTDEDKRQARLRYIARQLPALKAEVRALEHELSELKEHGGRGVSPLSREQRRDAAATLCATL
jgi:hypothetical protein